jgi:putative oxidoreductase
MLNQPSIAERVAFGRPIDPAEDVTTHLAPRPTWMLVGRILIAAIFLLSGFAKLMDTSGTVGYMEAQGLPSAYALAIIAGLAEVLGGLAILFGFLTRLGAFGLMLFLVPTTAIFHDFWNMEGMEAKAQMVNFMKNLAILGGLALLVANGAGRYSIDARLRRPIEA